MKIFVIDYGFGNLHSVIKAFRWIGTDVAIVDNPRELKGADGVILPGVGAFGEAINALKKLEFDKALMDIALENIPLLGICLGMELLFSSSEEFGYHEGLNLIGGSVENLPIRQLNDGLIELQHFSPSSELVHWVISCGFSAQCAGRAKHFPKQGGS